MHESPPSSGMSLPMAGGKMAGQCLFWGAVGTGALLIVALLLLTRKTSALCNSEACRYYGRLLAGSLNTSVDPCNDFHSYVCSGWEAVHHRSVMGFVYDEFIRKVAGKVGRTHVPAEHQTAILKAAKFFQSCQKVYTERSSDLGAVRSLLAQAGVLWPEMSTSARLLPMIFWMAAAWNWGAVIELLTDKPGLFTVRPASVYYLTLQRRRSMLGISDEGKYRKYFDKMAQAFRRSNASALPFEELVKLEQRVVPRLQRSYDAPFFNTLPNASLDQVALMTAGATNVSAWRKQLVAHFNATPAAGGRYSFIVENREFFSAFFALVAEVGEPQMAYYVGWATVQVMALLSNADLIRYYFLSDAEAEAGHAQFCAGLTHMYMGLAFYADYIRLEIKGHETLGVIAIVRTIRQSYSESLSSSAFNHLASGVPWLADTAADEQDEATFELVRSAKDEGALDRLFREFPNMTGDVLDNIAVATQARRRTPADTTMERFIANQTHRVLYLRIGHFKFLPTAFEVPVYHAEAPLAINYGALGSEIANAFTALLYRALVQSDNDTWRAFLDKASCVLGAPVSPGARLFEGVNLEVLSLSTSIAGISQMRFQPTEARFGSDGRDTAVEAENAGGHVMQRATSVRLLHQAFVRAFGQTPQPRLEDLREVDDAQLLFIAWCFSQCGRPGARHLCNEPLAVLPAFGRVFSCRSGSPLYSGKECAVLH
ncbi:hypothetical protein V5799_006420 [Amblyomma americanum]|uniref:Peptidase M13 N-terminal domain-containing protein n=1 Tax=Amblyomma americanum TaxID=6943 RepID=A0AAQ4DWF8_AMBAM